MALAYPKCGLPFLWFWYYWRFDSFGFIYWNWNPSKLLISPVILTARKRKSTFWKCQDQENFLVIDSRIVDVKVGWRLNVTNKLRRRSIRLATVMFRGTPCMFDLVITQILLQSLQDNLDTLSICHKLKIPNPYILVTWGYKLLIFHTKIIWSYRIHSVTKKVERVSELGKNTN